MNCPAPTLAAGFSAESSAFVRAALVYLALSGLGLLTDGSLLSNTPSRPAFLHLFTLGFLAFMIYGLGAHMLPRFTGNCLRSGVWPWLQMGLAHGGVAGYAAGFFMGWHGLAIFGALFAWLALLVFVVRVWPVLHPSTLGIIAMTTPLYPTFKKRIGDATEQLIQKQVTPWFFLNSGRPFRVKKFDGREIAYEGIGFEGSPSDVFWSRYIDPFLEALVVTEITTAVSLARERGVDARLLLPEIQQLLNAASRKVLSKMAEVDRRLRGKGFPEKAVVRSVEWESKCMSDFIEEHITSELAMWKPKSKAEEWYERNKFWVWVAGILVAIAGLYVKLR